MIIDASNLLIGRLAAFVAKKALLGEKIDVVNCENAIISGSKSNVLAKYKQKRVRRTPKGPHFPRMPDRFVRRIIRGMLPYKRARGEEAFERIMCHIGIPESLQKEKVETLKQANVSKLPTLKYVKVGDICKELGANV